MFISDWLREKQSRSEYEERCFHAKRTLEFFNVLQRTLIMLRVGKLELLDVGESFMRTTLGGLNFCHRGPLTDELID